MNSFIPWVGGKGKLLWIINKLMPDRYTRFIDVFGGSGCQLLRHHPSAAPASGKRQLQRKGAAECGGTDRRGQRRGHYDFSLISFIFQ